MSSPFDDAAIDTAPAATQRARLLALRKRQRMALQGRHTEPISPRRHSGPAACSFSQEALWVVEKLVGGAGVYNIAQALRIGTALDVAALDAALQALLQRHEVLRTAFEDHDGVPLQGVRAGAVSPLSVIDAGGLWAEGGEPALQRALIEHAQRPFDLTQAPLLRASLWRLSEREHVLLLVVHHIVADGWSMQVIARELSALYGAFSRRQPSPLAPLPLQFADWAEWQRKQLQGEAMAAHLRYWADRLAALAPLELPTDLKRPLQLSHAGRAERFSLPPALLDKLNALALRHDATLFMLLLAAFKVVLMRHAGQTDVAVGSPVAGRTPPETEGLVGYFVNSVVLRTDLSGNPRFSEALARVRQTALDAYTHQDLPFEKLVAEMSPQRDLSRNPLYQVSFALNNQPPPVYTLGGAAALALPLEVQIAKFDLSLSFVQAGGELRGLVEYSTELFEHATIQRLAAHVQNLLAGVVADAEQPIAQLPLLGADERRLILDDWNRTEQPYPLHIGVHTLFEQQVARTPEAVALVFEGERMSYAELNAKANQLAHHLRALGVAPDVLVGVYIERSLHLPVALLAVLKAGGAFVPMDPELPAARLPMMLEDTAAPVVLTQSQLVARLRSSSGFSASARLLLCLDRPDTALDACEASNPPCPSGPESLAYVIFTSGPTGWPKGVQVTNKGLSNQMHFLQSVLRLTAGDRLLQKTPIGFDASVWEFFAPLQAGAVLVIAPPGEPPDAAALAHRLREQDITVLQMAPAALDVLVGQAAFADCTSLRQLWVGGEGLTPALVGKIYRRLPTVHVSHWYGPTEASGSSHCFELPADWPENRPIPIGKPIPNTQCFILDAQLQAVPIGAAGELFVGGAGLARGYLNRPQLTAERFIAHPFAPGQRLFRTGDLARFRADGNIESLGRIDAQLRIRGRRIDLAEIDAALSGLPGVRQAVAEARGDASGAPVLVAYVVADPGSPPLDIKRQLGARLTEHMLATATVMLDALPLLSDGKLDRAALPAPDMQAGVGSASPPVTPAEQIVWDLWRDVLGHARFGVHDDFFELGGHSLLATKLMSRLHEASGIRLPLRTLFESPTVAALARHLSPMPAPAGDAGGQTDARAPPDTIPRLSAEQRRGLLPLSAAQQRMAFWHDLSPGTGLYNLPIVLDLDGPLDAARLQDCLRALMHRHEVLRTRWVDADGQRWQRIDDRSPWRLDLLALEHDGDSAAQACEKATAREALRDFDLATEAPMRALLITLGPRRHRFVWTLHHSVCDGWSATLLLDELALLYAAACAGQPALLSKPPLQYTDIAAREAQGLAQGVRQRELAYWQQHLAGAPASVELPTDHPRPAQQRFQGATLALEFSAQQAEALQALARRSGTTLFMVVLALWQILLHRYGGQATVVSGTVSANRDRRELETVVGCFTNTLALRTDFGSDFGSDFGAALTVAELLAQVKAAAIGAFDHQQLPFDEVVDALKLPRDGSRMPLVQTFVVLQPPEPDEWRLGGVHARRVSLDSQVAKFDLSLELQLRGALLAGCIEYDTALFERASIERMAGHLHTLADAMCAGPGQAVDRLPLLSDAERKLILNDWNRTEQAYPHHLGVHTLVEQQVRRTPDANAVVLGSERLSYAELNAKANQLAHHLRGLGVGPDVLVGVCMERSLQLAVALLAVLKAGGAFVPLDPELPPARLALMLEDTVAPVVLTHWKWLPLLPAFDGPASAPVLKLLCLDHAGPLLAACDTNNPPCLSGPESLAYVIYTSGSTGRPKGVMSLHKGLSNHILWLVQALAVTPADRLLQKTTISFDAAVWEFFTPWLAGATLVMAAPGEHRDPRALVRTLRAQDISIAQFVPSALRALLDEPGLDACRALRFVVSGGEALDLELARTFRARLPHATLGNFYGVSEASDDATHMLAEPGLGGSGTVPIGRPIANVRCYVLDAQLQPLPIGAAGELFVGGIGLARGYLNRPELTAERFIAHPFEPGERLYRTGDRARWRADGVIEYLGRIDFQVKIRGQRIELGEIEAALNAQPGVHQAVVIAREDTPGAARLVAYVVGAGVDPGRLRQGLAALLPESMVPSAWVVLASLPALPNGKIDRKALPAPSSAAGAAAPVPPRTPTEQAAWEVWRGLLRSADFGVHDDFFVLGGQSLLAAQMMARLRAALQIELPLQALFDAPTVAALALRADQAAHDGAGTGEPIVARGHDRPVPLSAMQRSMWMAERVQGERAAYHMPSAERLRGQLDPVALERALGALVQRHDSLRLCIVEVNGAPLQRLDETATLRLEVIDLASLPATVQAERLQALMNRQADLSFDLAKAPLARAMLVKLADEEHVFHLVLHHLVSDAWSAQLLSQDLSALYQAFAENSPAPPPRAEPGYLDYAAWEAARFESGALVPHTRYWTRRLGELEPLNLPFATPRAANGAAQAGPANIGDPQLTLALPADVATALAALARNDNATLFMVYLAAFKLLLMRWCDQTDIAVGTPIARRDRPELAAMVGPLLNTLVLRTDLSGDPSFEALLARVRDTALQAYLHQEQPFDGLVAALNPRRVDGRNPLFDVMVNSLPDAGAQAPLPGLASEPIELDVGAARFALTLNIESRPARTDLKLHYRRALFEPGQMAALLDQFGRLLAQLAAHPQQPISSFDLSSDAERQLLRKWNDTALALPKGTVVHRQIWQQAERTPDRIALGGNSVSLSYAELQHRANRLARALRARGMGRGSLVGLCLPRTPDMVVAQLAILQSGAAYVPLDPSYPAGRLAHMAHDADLALLLSDSPLAPLLEWPADRRLLLDHDAPFIASQSSSPLAPDSMLDARLEDPAYVIYTSGSTGRPKGVVVPHGAVINFLASMAREPGLSASDVLIAVTTLSFDIAVLELLLPLSVGAQLVLASRDDGLDGRALKALLEATEATVMQATPTTWRLLAEAGWQAPAEPGFKALIGGETLPADLARQLLARLGTAGELWNLYGPTETTVWSTCARVLQPELGIRIGRPIANTQVHVLDARGKQCPIGMVGEIFIGGQGVALGYLGRPELTAERFVADPFSASAAARMYRTGDRGRWCHDGMLDHLGRLDFQVKVRGHRIELGEIEAELANHAQVARALVIVREDRPGDVRLVAYVVAQGSTPTAAELRKHLRATLPEYMLPQHFIPIDKLPLLPNGKTDRAALSARDVANLTGINPDMAHEVPRNETERAIAQVWQELLQVAQVGRADNFFDLGGHSLLALRAAYVIEQRCGLKVDLRRLVHESLAQLAVSAPAVPLVPEMPRSERRDGSPARTGLVGRILDRIGFGRGDNPD